MEERPLDQPQDDGTVRHHPKLIFSGECDHYYADAGMSLEGLMNVRCGKCPMGTNYDPAVRRLVEGRII